MGFSLSQNTRQSGLDAADLTPASVKKWVDRVTVTSDQCTKPTKDRPVNGPLVRLKLGLGVKRHTDRGISWCRGCWDVNLWGLGVLLRGACHLSTQKVIRKQDLTSLIPSISVASWPFLSSVRAMVSVLGWKVEERRWIDGFCCRGPHLNPLYERH